MTNGLFGKRIITRQEISGIESQPNLNEGQRGAEVVFLLYDKISESDAPVQCLLKICDVFESGAVNDASLKKHGANMRSKFTGNKSLFLTIYFKIIIRNNHILFQSTAFTFNKKSLYWTKYVTCAHNYFQFLSLALAHLALILSVLEEAMFDAVRWMDLGLYLGLYKPTLEVIEQEYNDINYHLRAVLVKWLERADSVRETTWQILIDAVRRTGDNAAADRILTAILKSRNIVETQDVEKGNIMPLIILDPIIHVLIFNVAAPYSKRQ